MYILDGFETRKIDGTFPCYLGSMLVYFFFSLLAISMPNCLSRTQTQRSQNSPAYRGNTHLEPVTTLTLMHMKLKRRQRQIGRELEKQYWDDVLASHP